VLAAAGYGAAFGLFPIGWIVLAVIFFYTLTVNTVQFEVVNHSVEALSPDRRIQTLLIGQPLDYPQRDQPRRSRQPGEPASTLFRSNRWSRVRSFMSVQLYRRLMTRVADWFLPSGTALNRCLLDTC
jgi:hypothetical protein